MAVRKNEGGTLLFFRRTQSLPSGVCQLVGVMLLFLIKKSAKKEQTLHSSNSQLENMLGGKKSLLLSHTKTVNNMDAVSVISLSGPWTLDYCLMHFKSPAAGERQQLPAAVRAKPSQWSWQQTAKSTVMLKVAPKLQQRGAADSGHSP